MNRESIDLVKVWPLRKGLNGRDFSGRDIELQPGLAGLMRRAEAEEQQKQGNVQIMAGLSTRDLKPPIDEPAISRDRVRAGKPAPRAMKAESPKQKATDQEEAEADEKPKPARKTYKRRDITAEKV